ncbi:MAG: pilus assembly protein N-terminal domain-containing protein [Actinomycetospora chiangmaiensis]|nr:pilus assembly protein N-terminal domain-containing protein [Actinomycetospora chiangmaiensis]
MSVFMRQVRAIGLLSGTLLLASGVSRAAETRPARPVGTERPSPSVQAIETDQDIDLVVKQGRLLQLPGAATKIMVADPKIASFQVASPTSVFVFAESAGTTSLYALDASDKVIAAMRLVVTHDLARLRKEIEAEVPGAHVEIVPNGGRSLIVRGSVRTPLDARKVIGAVSTAVGAPDEAGSGKAGAGGGASAAPSPGGAPAPKVINQLNVKLSSQINIRVRVVEVSRRLTSQLGLNWDAVLNDGKFRIATGGLTTLFDAVKASAATPPGNRYGFRDLRGRAGGLGRQANAFGYVNRGMTGVLNALNAEGLATLLAEPNLTAMSGETASFSAGGEVPVVVITNNSVSINYKPYGVIMRMTPTLLSPNRISLRIAPEVSDLSQDGAVTLDGGSSIPAFKVRRAETTIELASGQSFALAGMLSVKQNQQVDGLPGLNHLPIGRLLETSTGDQEGIELVILATAYVVEPTKDGEFQTPGKGLPGVDIGNLPARVRAGFDY